MSEADGLPAMHGLTRRRFLQLASASLLLPVVGPAFAAAGVLAVRVWPARDYTRVTVESNAPLKFTQFVIKDPERLVVDLEGIEFNKVLDDISNKIAVDDPYIKLVRAGRFKPGVARLVLDLKAEIKPQVFVLPPVAGYNHRLVIDLYPAQPEDPLMALLNPQTNREKPRVAEPAPAQGEAVAEDKPARHDKPEKVARTEDPPRKSGKSGTSRLITIAIDAGHGGEDPGAVGRSGTYEKNITLSVSRKLKEIFDDESGIRAVLIRDGDYFIPLHQRVAKARKVQADLFMSIHADAFVSPNASGSSVFALSENGATSTAARWLAKKENDADLIGGVNLDIKDKYLAQTILDLSLTATINDSLKLGKAVLNEIGGINRLHKGAVEQAGFAVLKAPDIPSILIETAFISNPEEERKLSDDAYQEKMARAILKGVRHYFAKNPPMMRGKLT